MGISPQLSIVLSGNLEEAMLREREKGRDGRRKRRREEEGEGKGEGKGEGGKD